MRNIRIDSISGHELLEISQQGNASQAVQVETICMQVISAYENNFELERRIPHLVHSPGPLFRRHHQRGNRAQLRPCTMPNISITMATTPEQECSGGSISNRSDIETPWNVGCKSRHTDWQEPERQRIFEGAILTRKPADNSVIERSSSVLISLKRHNTNTPRESDQETSRRYS